MSKLLLIGLVINLLTAQLNWDDIDSIIILNRTENIKLFISDSVGNPLQNSEIYIEQLNHDYSFGTCISGFFGSFESSIQQQYEDTLLKYFNSTVDEWSFKWPVVEPIQDNLQHLMGDDKSTLEMYMGQGVIELEALTYIRGRSISNAIIIIDEAQNLTRHELKTIVTRVGEGTKIILTGDVEQIDNVYIDETSNGLTYAIEKLKIFDITGHVTLKKGERSKLATIAAQTL